MKLRHVAACLLVAAALLPCASISAEAIDIIQPGDQELSCKALTVQINDLSKTQAKDRKKVQDRASGGGLFKSLGKIASPVLDTVVSQSGSSTMTAAATAREVLNSAQASQTTRSASPRPQPTAPSLADQRLKRLNGLFVSKGC